MHDDASVAYKNWQMGMTILVTVGYAKARRVFKSITAPTAPPAMTLPRSPAERPGCKSVFAPSSNPPLHAIDMELVDRGTDKWVGVSKVKN
jgi:hypothetical protein